MKIRLQKKLHGKLHPALLRGEPCPRPTVLFYMLVDGAKYKDRDGDWKCHNNEPIIQTAMRFTYADAVAAAVLGEELTPIFLRVMSDGSICPCNLLQEVLDDTIEKIGVAPLAFLLDNAKSIVVTHYTDACDVDE